MPAILPIELVRHILVSLGPCSLDPSDDEDVTRQALHHCCLAFKALKSIAQALLYRDIVLPDELLRLQARLDLQSTPGTRPARQDVQDALDRPVG